MDSKEDVHWTPAVSCERDQLFLSALVLPPVDALGC